MMQPVVVAIDGGGSKTDAVAVTLDGAVVGRTSAAGASPHFIGVPAAVEHIDALVREVASGHPISQVNVYLSGLDLPSEIETFTSAVHHLDWSGHGTVLENDLYALLRTGTSEPDAVAVVCGTGINAIGRRSDGAVARFAALGTISGDWGGGTGLGESAIWHAARHADRRGPATSLTDAVPPVFGLSRIAEVTEGLHLGSIAYGDLALLAPVVFEQAEAGDDIAGQLVVRQGREIATMALACLDQLGLLGEPVPVVLGGGIIAGHHEPLWAEITSTLAARAPKARPIYVSAPPIVGAALLALESAGAEPSAVELARLALTSS
ncbi:MAG TPA: BadF/BadG/BcrA/BcrD ATPase family protein [Galbitalea sp.]|jgi:N-acetylglucosamine kinase-like BadF-type ATPase|nr:BadF/BadG/BcrA/BcrD ATPase family protein [Galbitalea sp.]